jgi:hypothetical protein
VRGVGDVEGEEVVDGVVLIKSPAAATGYKGVCARATALGLTWVGII